MGLPPPKDIRRRTKTTATGRGKDANKLEESRPRTGSGSTDAGREPAGASPAQQTGLFRCADQEAAGSLRPGRPDLQERTSTSTSAIIRHAGGSSRRAGAVRARRRRTRRNRSRSNRWTPAREAGAAWRAMTRGRDCRRGPRATRPADADLLPERGRSPFDEPDKPGNPPAAPRGGQAPLPLPPGDPFRLDDKPEAAGARRRTASEPNAAGDAAGRQQRPGTLRAGRTGRLESRAAARAGTTPTKRRMARRTTGRCSRCRT